jgi:hypothetical protein
LTWGLGSFDIGSRAGNRRRSDKSPAGTARRWRPHRRTGRRFHNQRPSGIHSCTGKRGIAPGDSIRRTAVQCSQCHSCRRARRRPPPTPDTLPPGVTSRRTRWAPPGGSRPSRNARGLSVCRSRLGPASGSYTGSWMRHQSWPRPSWWHLRLSWRQRSWSRRRWSYHRSRRQRSWFPPRRWCRRYRFVLHWPRHRSRHQLRLGTTWRSHHSLPNPCLRLAPRSRPTEK